MCGGSDHLAAECSIRHYVLGKRCDEVWNVVDVQNVKMAQHQENVIGSILEEMASMLKTSNIEGMFSVSLPAAVIPQFQQLMKVARLRKQGVDGSCGKDSGC